MPNIPTPAPQTMAEVRDHLLRKIGSAPVKLAGILSATDFYERHVPTLSPAGALSELEGIDFSRPVQVRELPASQKLQTFARLFDNGAGGSAPGLGNFYTMAGNSPDALGINTAGRHSVRVVTTAPIQALFSFAAGIRDTWSDKTKAMLVAGGSQQIRLADRGKLQLSYDAARDVSRRTH